jgi:hypothetical protein
MIIRMTKASSYIAATLAILSGSTVRGDVMPWSGASASVHVFGSTSTQTGSTATSSSQDTVPVTYSLLYYRSFPGPDPQPSFTGNVQGSADAAATGVTGNLLRVGANYQSPYTGTGPEVIQPFDLTVHATAGWSNDSLAIHGASIPNMARLNFAVNFDGPPIDLGYSFGKISVTANTQTNTLELHYNTGRLNQLGFDSVTVVPLGSANPYTSHDQAMFHLDLPVNAFGQSDPLQLSLQLTPDTGLASNFNIHSATFGDAILSLNSLTNTDGKLLSDLGDTVTFSSGMAAPVPEPSSITVVGGLIVAIAATKLRRSR